MHFHEKTPPGEGYGYYPTPVQIVGSIDARSTENPMKPHVHNIQIKAKKSKTPALPETDNRLEYRDNRTYLHHHKRLRSRKKLHTSNKTRYIPSTNASHKTTSRSGKHASSAKKAAPGTTQEGLSATPPRNRPKLFGTAFKLASEHQAPAPWGGLISWCTPRGLPPTVRCVFSLPLPPLTTSPHTPLTPEAGTG